jgi:hypothetical protein
MKVLKATFKDKDIKTNLDSMTFEDLFSYHTQQLAFQAKQSSREN